MRTMSPLSAVLAGTGILAAFIGIGASAALATPDAAIKLEPAAVVTPAVAFPVAAATDTCARKIRVVYSGYAPAPSACAALR